MSDQQVQALLTFFQFALLNQAHAEEAAQSAYQKITHLAKAKNSPPFETLFVQVTHQIYEERRKAALKAKQSNNQGSMASPDSGADLSPWRDFFRGAAPEEITVMIWSLILKMPLPHVSSALGLSTGTLQHRLSRGVRKLSVKLVAPAPSNVRRPWN